MVDQHGVLLLMNSASPGYSFADGPRQGGTPGLYERILIDPISFAGGGWQNVNLADGGKVLSFQGAGVVAHELAHTCAVWHHGDSDETVTWKKVIVYENGTGRTVLKENGQEITPLYENGSLAPWLTGDKITIGVPQGEHSGNADCIMRYFNSTAYRSQTHSTVRYEVEEVSGISLCTSPTGTGVNAAGRLPQSRYADAAPSRGNCKGQICVNDRHISDHQR